jgi:hypothetical protein
MSHNIDISFFFQKVEDPRIIAVVDTSEWGVALNKPSIVEITTPGASTPITHYWGKQKVNIFTTANLNLNCEDCCEPAHEYLPDGIYIFKVKASPDTFYCEKTFLQTAQFNLELDILKIDMKLECDRINEDKWRRIKEIEMLISCSEANLRANNFATAQELFCKAQDLIEEVKKCNNCF